MKWIKWIKAFGDKSFTIKAFGDKMIKAFGDKSFTIKAFGEKMDKKPAAIKWIKAFGDEMDKMDKMIKLRVTPRNKIVTLKTTWEGVLAQYISVAHIAPLLWRGDRGEVKNQKIKNQKT